MIGKIERQTDEEFYESLTLEVVAEVTDMTKVKKKRITLEVVWRP